jgi:hypothetical protein
VRPFARAAACLLFGALSFGALDAHAAQNDKEVEALIQSVLEADYPAANWKDGQEKLDLAAQACEGTSCSPKVRAKLFIAKGTVQAASGKTKEAQESFTIALAEDPTANLFSEYITPEIQRAFNEARSAGTSSGGTDQQKKDVVLKKPKKQYSGGGRAPRGWHSAEAFFYASEAQKSEANRDWLDCADYAQTSLVAENRISTRNIAASCEERAGLWLEALADYQIVADTGGKAGLHDAANQAKAHAQQLRDKIPKVILRKPAKVEGLVVTMNDSPIAPEKLDGEIWVNPGQRTVKAKGRLEGVDMEFEQVIDVSEFESATIDIKLAPKGQRDTKAMKCMLQAQTREDLAKCLNPGGATSLFNLHFGSELSGYHDTDHVDVISPGVLASVENPTGGWGFGASFLVDVVTAASADVVANASPRWNELRYVPSINGHKKFGDTDIGLHANLSHEPDYLATSAGASASLELANKTITAAAGYEFSYDVSGRAGTPSSVFSHKIVRNAADASLTFVVDKATIFAATFTGIWESGDSSKPYRYVPMFAPDIAPRVPVGLLAEQVNQSRLPIRALEQLPTSRQRYALAGLLAHRFSSSTFRAEERLYVDNWGLKATTTDATYFIDLSERLRVWPHVRFNAQSAVSFWQLAYVAKGSSGDIKLPALRAGDRELGPLIGITGGAGVRLALGEKKNWGLSVAGNVLYNRYLDHLYILQRIGYFGASTLEVDFE